MKPNWVLRDSLGCLQTGDVILTPSLIPGTEIYIPIISHIAVVGHVCNVPYVYHIPWGKTPILESLEKFEGERKITRVLRNEDTQSITDKELQDNYLGWAKKKYNFFSHNCEDALKCLTNNKIDIGYDQRMGYFWLLVAIIMVIFIISLFRR